MDPVVIDSLLQVTPEQKAALDESRAKGDSIFKDLRKQKHEAEKALGQALESRDAASIDDAKSVSFTEINAATYTVAIASVTARVLFPPSPSMMGQRPPTLSIIKSCSAWRSVSVIVAASLVVPNATI